MVAHFPTPFPDELLYSICARFSSRVAYFNKKFVLLELLGATTASAVIDLPNRLGHLASALPPYTSLTVDYLIDKSTLFAFFGAFMSPDRVKRLRRNMEYSDGPATHLRSGVMASRIPVPSHLRFCPVCRQTDKEYFGETYWHRLHQLPGVEVCPSHQTFLEHSCAGIREGRKRQCFISAEEATITTPVRHIDIKKRGHRVLLQVAQDAQWLLEHPSTGIMLEALYNRYLWLLIERELATYTGSVHVKKFLKVFSSFYSPALLKLLNCELKGREIEKTNWLLRLVRPPKHAQHPLYHLLLIQFFGCTAEEFFKLPEESSPFGESPWPCLNPTAAHYRQPVIMQCQLGEKLRYGRPAGRFSCECGFAYIRTGPDSLPEDRFRVGRMISFGQVWESKLKQLWEDSTLSISEIGKRLNVDPLTVRRHASRLELLLPRSDKGLKPLTQDAQLKGEDGLAAWKEKRYTCRSKWLSAMKQQPEITLKALRRKFPQAYTWLLQNDYEWLDGHKPRTRRLSPLSTSVNWKRRDVEYAIAVRGVALRIKEAPGRPVQLTRTAIGRALGAVTLLRQKLHNMPLTAQILAGVLETREQFAIRRIWWAADKFCQENSLPSEWQLISKANVYRLIAATDIKNTIQSALARIRLTLSRSPVCKVNRLLNKK